VEEEGVVGFCRYLIETQFVGKLPFFSLELFRGLVREIMRVSYLHPDACANSSARTYPKDFLKIRNAWYDTT